MVFPSDVDKPFYHLHREFTTIDVKPSGRTKPKWEFLNNGAEITQKKNSDPGIIVGNQKVAGVDYNGTFFIDDRDDDFVGIVFSYQDNTNFYLVSWKAKDQDIYGGVSGYFQRNRKKHHSTFVSDTPNKLSSIEDY